MNKIIITEEDIIKLEIKHDVAFTEEYRRGVHETWGGRAVAVYDLVYNAFHNMLSEGHRRRQEQRSPLH